MEDEPGYDDVRDPYRRVGEVVTDSRRPRLLLETSGPILYHLLRDRVDLEVDGRRVRDRLLATVVGVTVQHHRAVAADMDPVVLYRLLALRVAVFVVEQAAAYPDLDGRDVEPGAEQLWSEEEGAVLATLRVLREPGALRIGRVAAAPAARSRGVASALMRLAVDRCRAIDPSAPVLLDAQEHLAPWYAGFGFAVAGPGHEEDGIPHVPMRLPGLAGTD